MRGDAAAGRGTRTRRAYLAGGGAVLAGGLFAGCTGDADTGPTAGSTSDPTGTRSGATETTSTPEDSSYSVTMAPMGEVEFESAPRSVFTRLTHHADMALALGRGDDINALHAPQYYHDLWNQFTARLDGVSVDWRGLYSSWQVSKETLYELDSDVHLADPASVSQLEDWDEGDIEEVGENVAPWFGNTFSDTHRAAPGAWADRYEYYTLWEIFGKVAAVFREVERYEALAEVHASLLDAIDRKLPWPEDRPTAVMITTVDFETIWAYNLNTPGFMTAHARPLGVTDAFGDRVNSDDTVDFETLLEADPDVVFYLGGMNPGVDMAETRDVLEDDPVALEIAAVANGRVYAQGARFQGPILNLFQLEMTAKQLYPEQFGEWPTYVEGPYPEIPEEEQLFDRDRVASVINGDV